MPVVSVIIPIYKVEEYIDRCIQSVLNQTESDIEIILVDDGSPDRCPEICDSYQLKDNRIKVIHKKNGGLASARNAGLDIATGKYIFFLDSDDWIDSNTLEELVRIAEEQDVDFVRYRPMYANWPNHKDGELCDFGTENGMKEGLYTKDEIRKGLFPRMITTPQLTMGVVVAAWRSLYKKSFLDQYDIRFNNEVRYSEDSIFSAKVIYHTNRFYYLDGPRYYHYFFNKTSITKSFKKDRWNSCLQLMKVFDEEFSNKPDYDFSNQLVLQKIYSVMTALGQRGMIENKKERKQYCKEICDHEITRESFKHLDLVDVPWKLKVLLLAVKYRQIWILTRV